MDLDEFYFVMPLSDQSKVIRELFVDYGYSVTWMYEGNSLLLYMERHE